MSAATPKKAEMPPEQATDTEPTPANDPARAGAGNPAAAPRDAHDDKPRILHHERRRELRERPVSGSGLLEGIPFSVFDWNSSGICFQGYDGALKIGDRTGSHVQIEVPDRKFDFQCDLIIVRRDIARKLIAGVFAGLTRQDRVVIATHFEALEYAAHEGLMTAIAEKK